MMPPEFISQLKAKYDAALASKSLFFTDTELRHLSSSAGIRFEIRYAPSLAKKPTRTQDGQKTVTDPFAPPYDPDLLVCEWQVDRDSDGGDERSYVVLLNKFCVVPRHFLLVTKAFRSQTSPPSPADLYALRSILEQAHSAETDTEWIAFYNCGPQSGASQAHKHFQFLPVDKGGNPFSDLITRSSPPKEGDVFNIPGLSFAHFIVILPQQPESEKQDISMEDELGHRFMALLDSMIDHLRHLSHSSSPSSLSYNLVMTQRYMILIPRSTETVGSTSISINSLGVGAGMILVKSQDQLDELTKIGIDQAMAGVTFPTLKEYIDPCSAG